MKYCNPQPFGIHAVSCLFPPVLAVKYKSTEIHKTIIKFVSFETQVNQVQILGKAQGREVCDARSMAMKLIYNYLSTETKSSIGIMFKRHHSTVIFAIEKCENLIQSNKVFKAAYERIKDRVENYLDNIPK